MQSVLGPIGTIFQIIGYILFQYYGWVVVVAIFCYLIWRNTRQAKFVEASETILLQIAIPKDNEKKELSAEQMFASLHGILRPSAELKASGGIQEHVSFEIVAKLNQIQFYVWTPRHLKDFVESQIYAQYPTVSIKEGIEDYSSTELGDRSIYGTELHLTNPDVLPIRTFTSFEVDPLAGITSVLAKLSEVGEEAWIQILARPIDDSWQKKSEDFVARLKGGGSSGLLDKLFDLPKYIITNFIFGLLALNKSDGKPAAPVKPELTAGQSAAIKAVEEKSGKLGYEVSVRINYIGPENLTKPRMQALIGGFKQFNTTNLNGFTNSKYYNTKGFLEDYRSRLFFGRGFILNIEELASLYHLPHKSVETPNMVWTTNKTGEPPANLPIESSVENSNELSLFAETNFRGDNLRFGLKRRDRGRHVYVVGQTGTGKSFLLQLLTLSDIYQDQGFAIIDPHGDFATDMLKYIPEHRIKDVVYFNPADYDHPIAFNPMEITDENLKGHISSELIGVLKRMFDSWGPRLEYILRYTILALLDTPDSTMLGITRMLTDKVYRKRIIANIKDPVVREFWVTEFAAWNEKFASEATAPVLNKVGAFVQNPLIRNIVGQPKSAFNLREIMDEGKILIVNLSRGQVGEDNAAILGALMVTKIQLAAMSRANMDLDKRRPFYLYVDEFQNFATDSFAVILSEARKYGLNLTIANQYTAQMAETGVKDAVFGNVGTIMSFRVGPDDSTYLAKTFEPAFEPSDLVKLHNQNIFISMMIDGEKAPPFSARTLQMPSPEGDYTPRIVELSNQRFASSKEAVSDALREWAEGTGTGKEEPSNQTSPSAGPQTNHEPMREQKPNFLDNLQNPKLSQPPRRSDDRQPPRQNHRNPGGHSNQSQDRRPSEHKPTPQTAHKEPVAVSEVKPGEEARLH